MSKQQYAPAFSIIEAVVSMVVSAIVIGLIFVVFTILSERMLDFKNQNQYVSDLNRLTYSLNKDIFESEKMIASDEGLVFYSYSGDRTTYVTNPEYLLRSREEFIDTFRIPVKQFRMDSLQNKTKTAVFQRLSINVSVNSQPMDLRFFKKVYTNELIKQMKVQ